MHWRRNWQPTPVFLPGESQGWGSLVGYRLWGHTESDTTEVSEQQHQHAAFLQIHGTCFRQKGMPYTLFSSWDGFVLIHAYILTLVFL